MHHEINLHDLADASELSIDYLDNDLAVIKDVKLFSHEQVSARLKLGSLAYCSKGKAQFTINGKSHEFHENQLFVHPSYVTVEDFLFSPDFEFKALFFTDRLLQSLLQEKMSFWNEVIYQHQMKVIDLPTDADSTYGHFFELMYPYIEAGQDLPFRKEIIQSLLRAAFLGLLSLIKYNLSQSRPLTQQDHEESHTSASHDIFQRFLTMLSHTEVKHQPIQYYAGQLYITPKYLSSVCKHSSGKTANQWIREFTLEDIRYQLLSTNHTMKEIANLLGFPNSSFFGKYVRENFGMSPKAFRDCGGELKE